MQIAPLLHVGRGVTAIIGGGGKTTLMETLAGELSKKGKVIITTTTHICRPKQYETLLDADEAAVSAALERSGIVCVASQAESGKLCAPCDGIFTAVHRIGDTVEEGETIGFVEGQPMKCTISGVLRGVLDDGVPVKKGMKSGDVDPRCKPEYCTTISDKALAVGGGVVEAVLYLNAKQQGRR